MRYPANTRRKGISGKVWLTFDLTKEGKIENIVVNKGVEAGLDKEAVRVFTKNEVVNFTHAQWTTTEFLCVHASNLSIRVEYPVPSGTHRSVILNGIDNSSVAQQIFKFRTNDQSTHVLIIFYRRSSSLCFLKKHSRLCDALFACG